MHGLVCLGKALGVYPRNKHGEDETKARLLAHDNREDGVPIAQNLRITRQVLFVTLHLGFALVWIAAAILTCLRTDCGRSTCYGMRELEYCESFSSLQII